MQAMRRPLNFGVIEIYKNQDYSQASHLSPCNYVHPRRGAYSMRIQKHFIIMCMCMCMLCFMMTISCDPTFNTVHFAFYHTLVLSLQ